MFAFVYSCLLALAVQKIFLPMMPDLHGGHGLIKDDSMIFHNAAVELAARISAHGWSEWSLFPSAYVGNVGILAALYALFGAEPAVFIPLNAAAHATGALMLSLLGPVLWPGKIGRIAGWIAGILFIASPSALAWYSQNHKDAFAILGIFMMLYGYLRIQQMGSTRVNLAIMFSLGLAGVALLTIVRPYFPTIVASCFLCSWLACFFVTLIQRTFRKDMFPILVALLFVCMIGAAAFGASKIAKEPSLVFVPTSESLNSWKWKETPALPKQVDSLFQHISNMRVHFICYGRTVGATSGLDEDRVPSTTFGVLAYMPRALFIGLFAPFPGFWSQRVSIPRLAAAIETAV